MRQAKLLLPAIACAVLQVLAPAHAQNSATDARAEAVISTSTKLSRAMGERARAYASWQAENPLANANAVTFDTGLPTWETTSGLTWATGGTAEQVFLCLTLPVVDNVVRTAVSRAASLRRATLVGESCDPISGEAALRAPVLGLRQDIARAQVMVTPAAQPGGRFAGVDKLIVGRDAPGAVSLQNLGTLGLSIQSLQVSAPFEIVHDCPTELAPSENCHLSVAIVAESWNTAIGRLELVVGDGGRIVVPLKSVLSSVPTSVSLTVAD